MRYFDVFYGFCRIFAPVMVIKTEALVLRSFKYGESKMVVDTFTFEGGRLSFIVPMPKSNKGKMKKQLFQPLSLLAITADVRQKMSLHKMCDAAIAVPYVTIPFDPYKLSISFFLAEFLCHALKGEQRNEPLFLYIKDGLRWLDGCRGYGFANFHLVFLMRLSRFLGFYPNLDDYDEGDFFDLRTGCFTGSMPLHSDVLAPSEASKLGLMMRMDYQTMHLFRMSRAERNRLLAVAVRYYSIHIPGFPELKSLSVLRDMFQ